MPDFHFLSSASVVASHYSASASSFPCFLSPPHSGFLNASGFPLGLPVFHLLFRLVSLASFPVSGTRLSVRFLSPFPDSLPQLFLRCVPCAFAFGLSPFLPLPFVHFRSGSGYSAFCFFFSLFFLFPPHSGFFSVPFRFRFLVFPALSSLISHAFLPGSGTQLSVCFLSSFPVSLPQLFHRCLPSAFAFGLSPSFSAFFRPLLFRF